jgi:hypothetical protein
MNLEQHLYNFRRGIKDTQYSEILCIDYLNQALRDIAKIQKVLRHFEGERTWSSVAYQQKYALPAIHAFRPAAARFDNEPIHQWDKTDQERLGSVDRHSQGTPLHFCLWNGYLELWPLPQDAADSTTLDGGITATATTITLASMDGFEDAGRAIIDSEVISWTNIDATNLQLEGCERGLEGTVAAAHLTGATITERNIELFCGLYPKKFLARPIRSATATAATNGSACTDGSHSVSLTYYSTKWGSESLAQDLDDVTVASNQQIGLANIPKSDDGDVDYIRIYMTTASGTTPYFVAQIANGTTTYTITTNDTDLAANTAYSKCESDVPYGYRDAIDDLAIAQWFFDNEQFERWTQRKASAINKINSWEFALEQDLGGGAGTLFE